MSARPGYSDRADPRPPSPAERLLGPIHAFLRTEAGGSAILLASSVAALAWANSPAGASYEVFWTRVAGVGGRWTLALDLRHWVNDGLMAFFFFVVGLEIKRELAIGELSERRALVAPVTGAIGGMLLPALAFLALNPGGPGARGWGIPIATDIAFAVGVLGLLGGRIAPGLRLLLLTIAIVDDMGAVLVIALVYTSGLGIGALLAAFGVLLSMVVLWRSGLRTMWIHVPAGVLVWLGVLESGVHATVAGVVLGLLVPARPARGSAAPGPLERLEHAVHPWTAYLIVPLFALANAGIPLSMDVLRSSASSPVAQGIALGLFAGKPLGVVGALALATRVGGASLPTGSSWAQIWGLGFLTGIGFTVSLFVTALAFPDSAVAGEAKIGVFAASLAAALAGYAILRRSASPGPINAESPSP